MATEGTLHSDHSNYEGGANTPHVLTRARHHFVRVGLGLHARHAHTYPRACATNRFRSARGLPARQSHTYSRARHLGAGLGPRGLPASVTAGLGPHGPLSRMLAVALTRGYQGSIDLLASHIGRLVSTATLIATFMRALNELLALAITCAS